MKNVLIIGGLAGTGSSTVAKQVAERTGLEYVYAGAIFRRLADEAGESIEQFNETLKQHPERERQIDTELIERARHGDVVIESRVLGWLLPQDVPSLRYWLTCADEERIRRINQRESSGDAAERVERREALEFERYRVLYDLDQRDHSVFDLVVDTTSIPAAEVANRIIALRDAAQAD